MLARYDKVLRQITYLPGYSWRMERETGRDFWLQLVRHQPGQQTLYGRKWRLSLFMTDTEIVQTALKAVLTFEEHEVREAFRYKGFSIFSPHYDVEALVHLCHQGRNNDQRAALTQEEPR